MPDLLDTRLENRWLVYPNHANNIGSVHGGYVMMWMDQLGAMSAMRFAGRACVTARFDQINFERPVDIGDITVIESYVYAAGRTSVRVRLRASREDPRTGETVSTAESYAVYVAIDQNRQPVEIGRELTADSEAAAELREAAIAGDNELGPAQG
jgi:acyl-CoA hydrolase